VPDFVRSILPGRSGFVHLLRGWLTVAVTSVALAAQTPAPANAPLPQPVGYVNDFANVLSPEAEARIDALARRVHAATRGDMVVVTLPDLQGRPVEEIALRLGREWKVGADAAIGDQARNAGVIILVVPKETASDGRGRCRIETGQGAEGFITDATAGALCREQIPRFQAQDYSGALEPLAEAVADRYAAAFGVTLDGQPREERRPDSSDEDPSAFGFLVLLVILFIVFSSLGGRRRRGCIGCIPLPIPGPGIHLGGMRGGGWGGGGFGGGGFGGGGFGGFGGGGGFSGGGGGSDW
jgi:uncharacterized protein